MKTIIVLLIVLFFAGEAGASNPTSPANYNFWTKLIKNKVNSYMLHPGIKGEVKVNYSLNTDGEIVINQLNSSDQELELYVRSQFRKIKINHLNGKIVDEEMVSRFTFK